VEYDLFSNNKHTPKFNEAHNVIQNIIQERKESKST